MRDYPHCCSGIYAFLTSSIENTENFQIHYISCYEYFEYKEIIQNIRCFTINVHIISILSFIKLIFKCLLHLYTMNQN